jgi:hypothetical protein
LTRPIPFDVEQAYEHTSRLCYPRRVGSGGEARAADYVAAHFVQIGLDCRRESFRVSFFSAEVGNRLVFLACAGLALLGARAVAEQPAVAALCWMLAALFVNAPWRMQRFFGPAWPPRTTSENVVGTLPTTAAAPVRVVFMAHYDTKSQLFPTGIRVILVTASALLCGALALLALAAAIGMPGALHALGAWRLTAVVLVLLGGLLANITGNRSAGALDNGSAVGTLLELARTWRPRSELPLEAVFVATGSEEVELDGARDFLRRHAAWWLEKPTLLINLESVGAGSGVYLAGEPEALALARQVAQELGIQHATLGVLGAGMDHEPFADRCLPAVSILGDVVRASFAMHSLRDNMTIIEKPALERAGRLAGQLAWRWADVHATVPTAEPVLAPAVEVGVASAT